MHSDLTKFFDQLLSLYLEGEQRDIIVDAKKEYVHKTGQIIEDADDFEMRINGFYDWFLYDFQIDNNVTILQKYVNENKIGLDLISSFESINYSIFEFKRYGIGKKIILRDLILKKNFSIPLQNSIVPLIEGDIFLGRILFYRNEWNLCKGVCFLPQEVIKPIGPFLKLLIKKKKNQADFLLFLEGIKNKWLRYGPKDVSRLVGPYFAN